MKRSSLFCAGWWPFIFLPLLLLLVLLFFRWLAIEEDVASNATAELNSAGQNWAKVKTFHRGRDVLITGTPPNQEAIEAAKQLAQNAYGVNSVTLSPDVKVPEIPPVSPELYAIVTGESIVLRGTLGDQASIDTLVTQAKATFGADNVVNKLELAENTSTLPDLNGFFDGLAGKALGLSSLTASINDDVLTLRGEVQSEQIKSSIAEHMTGLFSSGVINQLTVVAPPPVVEEPTIIPQLTKTDCLDSVRELLSGARINFASGKAIIAQDSHDLLEDISDTTKRCPEASFEVAGHTDSVGKLALNMNLSEQRAQAVVAFLVRMGSNAAQFSSAGYGPNQPIGDNATPEGRAQNRRIEFRLKN